MYKDPYLMRDIPEVDADSVLDEPDNLADVINDNQVDCEENKNDRSEKADASARQPKVPSESNADIIQQQTQQSSTFPSQSSETYYEVEKLLRVKRIRGKKHYLVKWKGNYKNIKIMGV